MAKVVCGRAILKRENFAGFSDLFFNRLRALQNYGEEAIAGVDAGQGSQGAFAES